MDREGWVPPSVHKSFSLHIRTMVQQLVTTEIFPVVLWIEIDVLVDLMLVILYRCNQFINARNQDTTFLIDQFTEQVSKINHGFVSVRE